MADVSEELLSRCVRPYYAAMAGFSATSHSVPYAELADVVAATTDEEVRSLLGSYWRPRAMGAWLAAGRTTAAIDDALLRSLATSQGLLTSPPLAAVAVLNVGKAALPAMVQYLAQHVQHSWGKPGLIVAAIEHIGGSAGGMSGTDDDRSDLASLLAVAERIAAMRKGA